MRSILGVCEQSGYRSAAQKEPIRTIPALKIAYDEIIFARSEGAEAQHSKPM